MDIKTEIVALAIRALANKTTLVRKPDVLEELITGFFGGETYDVQKAKQIIAVSDQLNARRQQRKLNKTIRKENTEKLHVSADRV